MPQAEPSSTLAADGSPSSPPASGLAHDELPLLAPNAAAAVLASLPASQHGEVREGMSWYVKTGPETFGDYVDGTVGGTSRTSRLGASRVLPGVGGHGVEVRASTVRDIAALIVKGAHLEHEDLPGLATALGRPVVVLQRYLRGDIKYLYIHSRLSLLDTGEVAAARCAGLLQSSVLSDPLFVYNESLSVAAGAYTVDEHDPRISHWARAARASFPTKPKPAYPIYSCFTPNVAPPPPASTASRSGVTRTVSVGVGSTRPPIATSSAASLPPPGRPPLVALASSSAPRRPAAGSASSLDDSAHRPGAMQRRAGAGGGARGADDSHEVRAASSGDVGSGGGGGGRASVRRTSKVDRARAAAKLVRQAEGAAGEQDIGADVDDPAASGSESAPPSGSASGRPSASTTRLGQTLASASASGETTKRPRRPAADLRPLPSGSAGVSTTPTSPRARLPPSPSRARTAPTTASRSLAASRRRASSPPTSRACSSTAPSATAAAPFLLPASTTSASDFWRGEGQAAMLRAAGRTRDEAGGSSGDRRDDDDAARAIRERALERVRAEMQGEASRTLRTAAECIEKDGEQDGEAPEGDALSSETSGSAVSDDGGSASKRRKKGEAERAPRTVEEGSASEEGGELERVQAEGAKVLAAYHARRLEEKSNSRLTWDGQRRPDVAPEQVDRVVDAHCTDLLLAFNDRDDPPALDQYAWACDPDRSRRPRRSYKRFIDDELVSCRVAENEMATLVGFGAQAPSGATRSFGEILLPLFGFIANFSVDVYVATPRTRDVFTTEAGREWAAQEGVQGVIFFQTRHSAHFEQLMADVNAYFSRCNAGLVADFDRPRILGAPIEMGGGVTSMHSKLFLGHLRDGTGVVELGGSANLSASALSEREPRTDRLRADTNVESWRLTVLPKGCEELSRCLRERDGVVRALAEQGRLDAAPRASTALAGEWLSQVPIPTSRPQPASPTEPVPIRPLPGAPRLFRGFAAIWAGNPELAKAIHAKGAATNAWLSQDRIYGAMLSSSGWEAKIRISKDGIGISMPDSRSSPLRETTDSALPDGGILAFTLDGLKTTWLGEHDGKNIPSVAKKIVSQAGMDNKSTLSESGAVWHVTFDEADRYLIQISVPAGGFSSVIPEGTSSAGSPFDGRTYSRAKMVGEFARRYRDVLEVAQAFESVQKTELGGSDV